MDLSVFAGWTLPSKAGIKVLHEVGCHQIILGLNNEVKPVKTGRTLPSGKPEYKYVAEDTFKLRWNGGGDRAYKRLVDSVHELYEEGFHVSLCSWLRPKEDYLNQKIEFLNRLIQDTDDKIYMSLEDCEGYFLKHGGAKRINKKKFIDSLYVPKMEELSNKVLLGVTGFAGLPSDLAYFAQKDIITYHVSQPYEVYSSKKTMTHDNIYRPGNAVRLAEQKWSKVRSEDNIYAPALGTYWLFHPTAWVRAECKKDGTDVNWALKNKQVYCLRKSLQAREDLGYDETIAWSLPWLLSNHKRNPAKNRAAEERVRILQEWFNK